MNTAELAQILPLFEGDLETVKDRLKEYPEIDRKAITAIRRVLGVKYSPKTSEVEKIYKDDIIREYQEDGMSIRQLAARYDTSKGVIHRILRQAHAIKSDCEFWTTFKTKKVEVLYRQGADRHAIARAVGTSYEFVSKKIREIREADANKKPR